MSNPTLESQQLVTHTLKYGGQKLAVSNFAADRLINTNLERSGVWEAWQLALMGRVIKPNFTCVDIGANIGINAMFMARLCPQGRVFAFEPFDAIYGVLSRNVEQNGLANLTAINKGISSSAVSMHMITSPTAVGGAHVTEGGLVQSETHATGLFHFVRLDEELRARGVTKVDFMKVDVEGHEIKALASALPYLNDPDLQLFIEFNPRELRRPAPPEAPFPDRQLFSLLRSHFKHIFFMGRDNTLFEISNYHVLRRKLMGGYFVDDLYCTNEVRPEVADLIVTAPAVSPRIRSTEEKRTGMTIQYANRDLDGWGLGDTFNAATMSMHITGAAGRRLVLKFDRMYAKHLHLPTYTKWPVWIMVGDASIVLDLYESPRELYIDPGTGPLDITIQSEHQTPAAVYLGNPGDSRSLGFRVDVVEV
ncbi:MAG TPA: FkbM family methyltransferase [Tepidisphaeraceae bacterium]|nr:FkbM family methyltransferase [Tepidisphaeraceae bacterium]